MARSRNHNESPRCLIMLLPLLPTRHQGQSASKLEGDHGNWACGTAAHGSGRLECVLGTGNKDAHTSLLRLLSKSQAAATLQVFIQSLGFKA